MQGSYVITATGLNCILAPLKMAEPSLQDAEMMKHQVPIGRDAGESVAAEAAATVAAVAAVVAVNGCVSWKFRVGGERCVPYVSFQHYAFIISEIIIVHFGICS